MKEPNSGSGQDNYDKWQELARIKQERYEYAQSQNASGERQMAAGDLEGAIASFTEAIEYHGESVFRRNLAFAEGLLAARNRDYAKALAKFRRAISLHPASAGPVKAAMVSTAVQANWYLSW